jgi:predicted nucleotidyltransferase
MTVALLADRLAIEAFCRKWKVRELDLFGFVLSDDFADSSDVDVLVDFQPDAHWGRAFVEMKEELEAIFGRRVDLLTRRAVERSTNPIRKRAILDHLERIYTA